MAEILVVAVVVRRTLQYLAISNVCYINAPYREPATLKCAAIAGDSLQQSVASLFNAH